METLVGIAMNAVSRKFEYKADGFVRERRREDSRHWRPPPPPLPPTDPHTPRGAHSRAR
ncbi:hypothetical protein C8Q76DRAFT_738977 [Earliella scabrosa]|nr:hypothetical protein C8Q76DRAFT_738977 [Earliella scabrosa]